MDRKFSFAVGEYYHIYNRGVEKRDIFLNEKDRLRFHKLLYVANGRKPVVYKSIQRLPLEAIEVGDRRVAIGAYALMPNHFHILAKEIADQGITDFMEKLTTGYSKYFNKKYERSGHLFQGRFKAEHVDNDEYLKYLFAYIHLNPIKLIDPMWKEKGIQDVNEAKKYLERYSYSSYLDYAGTEREEKLILSREEFPDYFATPHEFDEYVTDWLEYAKDDDPTFV